MNIIQNINFSFLTFLLCLVVCFSSKTLTAQVGIDSYGESIQFLSKDSSGFVKMGIRFQSLYFNNWDLNIPNQSSFSNHDAGVQVRRARLKFSGWAKNPKVKYTMQLGFTNADISGGNIDESSNAVNIVYDAYLDWNYYGNFSILIGQAKLPGNREFILSSSALQFVDRSLLNVSFALERDIGIHLKHHTKLGGNFYIKEALAITQGEGRNTTQGFHGGYNYTGHVEVFPLGLFIKNGEIIGSDLVREEKPKLAIAATYNLNKNAIRTSGTRGQFLLGEDGNYYGKDETTFFLDAIFKYKGWSIMGEYAIKDTEDKSSIVYDDDNVLVGSFLIGDAINVQAGYMILDQTELAIRYTQANVVSFDESSKIEEYTLGMTRFFSDNHLKFVSDVSYRKGIKEKLTWRMQIEFLF